MCRPSAVLLHQGVGEDEELPHHGSQSDLRRLSLGDEHLVLPLEVGVVLGRDQRGHEEQPANLVLPPWMKLRPFQCPDSRAIGASPARLAARAPVSVPSSGIRTISPGAVIVRDARDRGQDLGAALQGLLLFEPSPDLGIDEFSAGGRSAAASAW